MRRTWTSQRKCTRAQDRTQDPGAVCNPTHRIMKHRAQTLETDKQSVMMVK